MTVSITITDPTVREADALRAYLTALHGSTAVDFSQVTEAIEDHAEWVGTQTRELIAELSESHVEEIVTASDAGAPDFDSVGYPWDERIHAGSRATVADGTWRKKRGVADELVAEVEAELAARLDSIRANMVAPGPIIIGHDDDPEPTVEAPEVPPAPVQEHSAPEVPDAPVQAPPPPPAPTANPFLAVMSRIGKSKLDKAKKDELLTAAGALDEKGAPSILVLNKRPELIDGFIALLDSEGV